MANTQHVSVFQFISSGGLSLPGDVCLNILEDVIAWDPKSSRDLMSLSKSFHVLLCTYERSIVKRISTKEHTAKIYRSILLPSWPRTRCPCFEHSYPWLCEVRCRTKFTEDMMALIPSTDRRLPPGVPIPGPFKMSEAFKAEALRLLYSIADSTAAVSDADIHTLRARQVSFVESLNLTQLALLAIITNILGLEYSRATPGGSIRARRIVFEDRLLRYGPVLAWATLQGHGCAVQEWSKRVLSAALANMEAYETGRLEGYACLQNTIWKLFCARKNCGMWECWENAKEWVEREMVSERYEPSE